MQAVHGKVQFDVGEKKVHPISSNNNKPSLYTIRLKTLSPIKYPLASQKLNNHRRVTSELPAG